MQILKDLEKCWKERDEYDEDYLLSIQRLDPEPSLRLVIDSERRLKACRHVALSLCQLEGLRLPLKRHWDEALEFTWWAFQQLFQ